MKATLVLASILLGAASAVSAAPGLDDVIYGATVEPGKSEIEARYGRLIAASAGGEDAATFEAAHGFSSFFYGAALATFQREPERGQRLESIAVEGIFALGRIRSLDLETAAYGEIEHHIHGPDNLEAKLLLERRKGRFDSRVNLIAQRALMSGAPIAFGYALSADYEVAHEVRFGAEAFGELGSSHKVTIASENFVGPSIKIEFHSARAGELEARAGYLIPLGRAHDKNSGQLRLGLEEEF